MTTLYHFASPVKAHRTFGQGIHRWVPSHRTPYSAADLAWLLDDEQRRAEDARFDAMAEDALATARHERGLCC